jgi:hypothetical protein
VVLTRHEHHQPPGTLHPFGSQRPSRQAQSTPRQRRLEARPGAVCGTRREVRATLDRSLRFCARHPTTTIQAPPNGAAAAALEGGAVAGPPAPTSTLTQWAPVTPYPCHAWHGRGLNEVPAAAIRGISSCREALYGEFWKNTTSVQHHMDLPLGQSDMFFRDEILIDTLPSTRERCLRNVFLAKKGTDGSTVRRGCWSRRRTAGKHHHGMALASREFLSLLGARLMATQDGGWSQPEERHGPAAEVLRIIRRRKNPVRGVFGKYSRTQHLLWRGDSILVSDPPLP